ncbi:hypothetical protein DDZ15_00765 [Rhodohalobacter mucosus]|uniref:Uncharacterized protein n=1 Tax=Rhodohalobacter mucosus TaxID=2079485 RepID=A0A316TW69_9BACT|nr:hypothetical protein DDZ15_00765 [Rhodohalobacter mucosus]
MVAISFLFYSNSCVLFFLFKCTNLGKESNRRMPAGKFSAAWFILKFYKLQFDFQGLHSLS